MKLVRTEDAVGQVLCHDITQIIPGVVKDAVFRKGHIVTEEDIPVLLSVGKENLYIWEKQEGMLHENEAAEILRQICQGEHMHPSGVKEGKIELIADCDPDCRCDLCDHLRILICQRFPYRINIRMNTDRTCRTDNSALSAAYTVCLCYLLIKCRCYQCIGSTISKVNGIDILDIVTHTYAVSA